MFSTKVDTSNRVGQLDDINLKHAMQKDILNLTAFQTNQETLMSGNSADSFDVSNKKPNRTKGNSDRVKESLTEWATQKTILSPAALKMRATGGVSPGKESSWKSKALKGSIQF